MSQAAGHTPTPPICCVTGRIAGDSDACGDCDPCSASYAVPEPVRRLLSEKDEWREKYSDAMCAHQPMLEALREIASHNNAFLTDGSEATRQCLDWCVEKARAALELAEKQT